VSAAEVPDYHTVIKDPIALSTMQARYYIMLLCIIIICILLYIREIGRERRCPTTTP
jgi:hypothetical protein